MPDGKNPAKTIVKIIIRYEKFKEVRKMLSIRIVKDGKEIVYTNVWFCFGYLCLILNMLCFFSTVCRDVSYSDNILLDIVLVLIFCAGYLQKISERMP